MLNERQAEIVAERLVNRVEQANTYFLQSIGSSIKQIGTLAPSDAQQLIQMLKYGGNYEQIVEQLAKILNLNIKDIDKIFEVYAKSDQHFAKEFYKYRNVPFIEYSKNFVLRSQTEALANIVKNEMYNFARTNILGYTFSDIELDGKKGKAVFYGLRETYNRVLDEALLHVGQGKESFNSAMTRIMKEIGGSGLKTINYESGRSIRLDSAVRMHLKGRLRELHNENQKIFSADFGADLVEITVHDYPAPDHAEAQGRQFDIEQYELLQKEGVATDLNGKTIDLHAHLKNGGITQSFRPISEMSCYHNVFYGIKGVTKSQFTTEQLDEINEKNEQGFDFEDKHYTNYEGTQLQRNIERKIREQKDIQILAKSSDNEQLVLESQENIRLLTQKYYDLAKASGLPTKLERLSVEGYKKVEKK